LRLVLLDRAYQRIIEISRQRNDRNALVVLMDHLHKTGISLPRATLTQAMDVARQQPVHTHAVNAVWRRILSSGHVPSSAEWSIALRAQEPLTSMDTNEAHRIWNEGRNLREADDMVVAAYIYGIRGLPGVLTSHRCGVHMILSYIKQHGGFYEGTGASSSGVVATNGPLRYSLWNNDVRREMARLVAHTARHSPPSTSATATSTTSTTSTGSGNDTISSDDDGINGKDGNDDDDSNANSMVSFISVNVGVEHRVI
jgi:hypothetical protein